MSGRNARSRGSVLEILEARRMLSGNGARGADMVLRWNDIAMNVLRADVTLPGPGWSSRSLAMTSLAVYDAVNSIERDNAPYLLMARGFDARDTSVDAAVASAAHDVLAALYPDQQAMLDSELAASLQSVPDGAREIRGVVLGRMTAAAMLKARAHDGASDVTPYTVNNDPGHWSPDPLNPTQAAWGPGWGKVTPFALRSGDQFDVPPPPALESAAYAAAYNEVKSLGARNSTTRTAAQTQIAFFWSYDASGMGSPPGMYDQQVAVIAKLRSNSLEDNARLFALVNMAQADSGISAWNSKFEYDFWRPVTAIRRGDEDGNAATTADTTWEPLGAPPAPGGNSFTPPFPAYVSGHATFGAAVYKVLADFYHTDHMRFTLTSDQMPGLSRSFTRFSQAAAENGRSRIYMGVHWNFDDQFGEAMGRQIADYTMLRELRPVHGHGGNGDGRGFDLHALVGGLQQGDGGACITLDANAARRLIFDDGGMGGNDELFG